MQVNEEEGEDEAAMSLYLEAANAEPKLPEDQLRACTAGLVLALARCRELERSIHLALELEDPGTTLKLGEMLEAQNLPQVILWNDGIDEIHVRASRVVLCHMPRVHA